MSAKRQQLNIRFHPHALDRLRQRFPGVRKEWLRGRLKQRVASELRKGVEPNKSGGLELEVELGIWAVCYPSFMGGWEVMTVYSRSRGENEYEHLSAVCPSGRCGEK